MKKYEIDKSTEIFFNNNILYRIKALKDFADIKAGDYGGYVSWEKNLSQDDNCWIYDDAKVMGAAQVIDNAIVKDNAIVNDYAIIKNNAVVKNKASIKGHAIIANQATVSSRAFILNNVICDKQATISGQTMLRNNAHITEHATITGQAMVFSNALVAGHAIVTGHAILNDNVKILNNAIVTDNAKVEDNAVISGAAHLIDNANVSGMAEITGDVTITSINDYDVFKNTWSSGRYFTYTKSNHMWKVGCFYGTGQELIEKAYADSERSGQNYERYVKFAEQKQPIHKKKIIITEDDKRKLADILDDDETKYFLKDIASYETECTLNEDWLNFTDMASKQHQIETYKSLKTDRERYIYATAIGQEYALDILCSHITDVLNAYDLECLNSFFKTVELVID